MKRWRVALAMIAGLLTSAMPADAMAASSREAYAHRMRHRGEAGEIAVRAGRRHFPENAEVSLTRTHAEHARRKIKNGLRRHRGVLAMYDISIRSGGGKWQPDAKDPVRVEVELEEPVSVATGANLGIAHLVDDGTVEEIAPGNYGFTYNDDRTAVKAFWFDATGFSVYAIVDGGGELVTPRRFYHFYGHPEAIEDSASVKALPYVYHDESNADVNVQIVKTGDMLKEPPIPPDILDEEGNLVSMFEGWYVVSTNARPANAADGKLDSTSEYFQFVWPVGVTDNRLTFADAVTVSETNDVDYWIVPLYDHARFLLFNDTAYADAAQGASQRIVDRKIIAINDESGLARIRVSDVSAALVNSRQEYFCGWQYLDTNGQWTDLLVYDDHGQPQDAYIDIDNALFEANGGNEIQLYPVYAEAHFLNFDTNAKGSGATYVGSVNVRSTSNFDSVTPSGNREGYDFAGWCAGTVSGGKVVLGERLTDANGNFIPNVTVTNATGVVIARTDANGYIRLNSDVTLYASWVANSSASYRVIVWQQRVTDSKDAADADKEYFYVTHYTSAAIPATTTVAESLFTNFTGTRADGTAIGSGVNLATLAGKADSNAANEDFTGFHYARWASDDATVAPDGSTVVNLYYDRNLITFEFQLYLPTNYTPTQGTSGTQYGTEDEINYFELYSNNGRWYRTRTPYITYSYSTEHTGTRYVKNGNNYTETTSNSGTQYRRDTILFVLPRYEEIYYNDADGKWYQRLTRNTNYDYTNEYSGNRYTGRNSAWRVSDTMTGLYGQSLAAADYEWSQNHWWYEGHGNYGTTTGSRTTFRDAFLPIPATLTKETFYGGSVDASANRTITFYKETLDEDWFVANTVVSESNGFQITDKYNGFTACLYSNDGGSWEEVGTKNQDGVYSGSPNYSATLDIRFKRENYELIYKDGDNTVYDTGKSVPYESPLAGYNLALNDSRLDWSGRDTSVGTFEGWFEDASLTVPFDFGATMPDGKKFLYAKWAPAKYKVIIDPNGGEMQSGDSTWFYLEYGEKVVKYTLTRNYRLDLHNGTHYYHHDLWDPVKDKNTDQYDPATAGAPRRAYYTTDIEDATTNAASNPENRYSYEPNAYAFVGWYEVLGDGTLATDPFNFTEPPNRPVELRALWRRTGYYTLKYESIDPDGLRPDEVVFDRGEDDKDGYVDDAVTTEAKAPTNYDTSAWIWEGWQVVDTYNNNIPLTDIRSPGDNYIVHDTHADRENTIHFRAVYKSAGDSTSKHIPVVTDLILDSNDGARLAAGAALPTHEGSAGTYTDGAAGSTAGLNQGFWFAGQQNNFSVDLAQYFAMFAHDEGYFLLGWDPLRNVTSLIPAYTAEQTVGADKTLDSENTLFATWEPQLYIEFVNETGDDLNGIELYIPSWVEGETFRVNTVKGTYGREVFTAFADGTATFSLGAGESLRLVLPDAADKDFAVFGSNQYADGTKLVVTRTLPQIDGQEAVPAVERSIYPGESYLVAGTMKASPEPVQIRFSKADYVFSTDVPVRYFLHHPDGVVEEITGDPNSWDDYDDVKKRLEDIGSSPIDIAAALQTSSAESVHENLAAPDIRDEYGYTTIGIGAATGNFDEWRSITKSEPSGGSYVRFYHERLEWSRYSHVWNAYDDAAVYVVFYKRIPVHVTISPNVVGSEEDKDKPFAFTAAFDEHSSTFEYTVTTEYKKTRTVTRSRATWFSNWSEWSGTSWEDCDEKVEGVSRTTPVELPELADSDLFPARASAREEFSLKDSERHPITIYFNRDDTAVDSQTSANVDSDPEQASDFEQNVLGTRQTATQTRTYSQTVTFRVTYQYESASISESADVLFDLAGIAGEVGSGHSGQANLSARSYTISSIQGPDSEGYYTYTPLDTAIFANERKTGSLTVTNTVVDGDVDDAFRFTVTLDETVVNKDAYTPPEGVHLGPYGKVFSFSLSNGDSVTLPGLPVGANYVVEEVVHDKYIVAVPANASGAIAQSGATVAFVNTRKTDLAIAMKDTTVMFTGAEQHGYDISTVTGTGSEIDAEGYTVTGLKSGHVLSVEHYVVPRGTTVGSYTGLVENVRFTVRDANEDDVTDEYLIEMTPGELTIESTPIVVTVTGKQETKTYNGEEQECLGYTYVITHATTHEIIENEAINVAIPVDYQSARRTNVGRTEMTLGPSHVITTVPNGITVTDTVVAANGYLEIAPAPVTVKADDKVKISSRTDPPLTATVTGLFGDDTVEYALSREAGETAGTYSIAATGEAVQGNYAVAFQPGTLTIEVLDLIQRATGSGVAVSVTVTDELITALGFDSQAELSAATVGEVMNRVDPNGLRHWENLVTGTATNQLMLSAAVDATEDGLTFKLAEDPAQHENLGYIVQHELCKHTGTGWTPLAEASSEQVPAFELESQDPTGFYRIVTQIVPESNLPITNQIPTTNIVGVLRVASAATHTMTAVPFVELPQDPVLGDPVKVADFIGSTFLSEGDALRLRENGVFKVWVVEDGKFVPYVSVSKEGAVQEVPGAAESTLAPGRSVWLTRADHSEPFIVVGQFTGEPVEVEIAGASTDESGKTVVAATMVTNPNMSAIKVNDIDWGENPIGGTSGDSIEIPSVTDGVMSTRLSWSPTKKLWGRSVPKKSGTRFVQVFESDFEIPAGLGFWYYRTGAESFRVTVKNAQKLD